MASKKTKIVQTLIFPRTIVDVKCELQEELNNVSKIHAELRTQAIAALKTEFELAGGCNCCAGRGWVVTWDTMDSMSGCYAEYGICPECTEDSRKRSGINLGVSLNPYDANRGIYISTLREKSATWSALVTPYEAILADLHVKMKELEQASKIVKGSRVVIKRGRNDVGKVGVVAYIKQTAWGDKVLVKDESCWQDRAADGVWTSWNNVEILAESEQAA